MNASTPTAVKPSVRAAAGVTVLLWASAFVGIRYAGRGFAPGPLALGRLLVGSVALGTLALVRREPLPPRRALGGIVACGLLWFGSTTSRSTPPSGGSTRGSPRCWPTWDRSSSLSSPGSFCARASRGCS